MAHIVVTIDNFHEDDALYIDVVLTDEDDVPITTDVDWEAEWVLRESITDDGTPVVQKTTQDGDITFEPLESSDIEGFDNISSTDGDKAVVKLEGEDPTGTAGDTATLLGTDADREETATYYFWCRAWNADGDRSTVNTGELHIVAH